MFDVRGDRILFHGELIATLCATRVIGSRIDAERALIEWQDPSYLVTEEDHVKEVEQAEKDGYDSGHADGVEAGKEIAEKEFKTKREQTIAEGRAAGRAEGLADAEKITSVERAAALLDAALKAYDALHAVLEKRYPAAKISECKAAMRTARGELNRAIYNFKA